jgi:DNA modification methylase
MSEQALECRCAYCGNEFTAEPQPKHILLCGDSTKADEVARVLKGQLASLCFTSPPYNAGANTLGGNKNRVDSKYIGASDNRPPHEYLRLLIDFTTIALSVSRTVVVNLQSLAGNKTAVLDWIHHFKDHFADRMVWFKGGGQPAIAANVMNSRFEDIWILSPERNPSRAIPTGNFHSTVSNVYEGKGASGENVAPHIHAASMPMHLAVHVLESLDGTKGLVFEPFCGTGTTIIAAEQTGRRCVAVEIEPIYVEVAVRRWEAFTGRRASLHASA